MVNQIGAFFDTMPDRQQALKDIAGHLKSFWEPRMRRSLLAYTDEHGGVELKVIVLDAVQTDLPSLGAARALSVARKQNDVALVAFDGIPDFVKMIQDGTLVASGMQQPYLMGEKSAEAMIDYLAGKTPEKTIIVPIVVVSKDNLQQQLPIIQKTVFGGEMK